jgi:hypothetical protein
MICLALEPVRSAIRCARARYCKKCNVQYACVEKSDSAPPTSSKKEKKKNLLQLLYGPQIVPDVRDRLDSDALFTAFISSVPSFVIPIPTANSLPSASNAIGVPAASAASTGGSHPPADVSPGHIMCAPASRKRIAPRSMRTCGSMNGSNEQKGKFFVRTKEMKKKRQRNIRTRAAAKEKKTKPRAKKKTHENYRVFTRICGEDGGWEGKARQNVGKRAARCAGRIWRDDLCCFGSVWFQIRIEIGRRWMDM